MDRLTYSVQGWKDCFLLLIYLSNEAVIHIIHIQGQILELLQNNLFETICNEMAVAYNKVLFKNLQGMSEENL